MESSPEKKSSELPIPALVSLLLASLALLVQQFAPLESPRPMAPNAPSYSYRDIEDVDARLWQDPFAALKQHDSSSLNMDICSGQGLRQHHEVTTLACSIVEIHKEFNSNIINVLGVMVFDRPYAEDAESRRRTRYAVLSGLAVKGYDPVDSEHIGYFEKPTTLRFLSKRVPFEWFKARNDGSPVLLLWLDETAFTYEPLKATRELVKLLEAETKKAAIPDGEDYPELIFKFIGPASSDTLQAMVNELAKDKNPKDTESGIPNKALEGIAIKQDLIAYLMKQPFEFYNSSATGDWPGIHINIPKQEIEQIKKQINEKKKDDNEKSLLQLYLEHIKLPYLLTRTSFFDNQLASAILEELKLRGIDPACEREEQLSTCYQRGNKDHIVLISEWDTHYGRQGLPDAMRRALYGPGLKACLKLKTKEKENECYELDQRKWVHPFSYMRGLDGVVPGEGKAAEVENANKEKDKSKSAKAGPERERSEGQGQKDYLRRLAVQIGEIERDIENNDEGSIRAIGVLGSDAYDKLMILQALRPTFPKAIFFTTDLDTRLMHPKEFDVTRNLVVAASFGLQLERNLQKSVPPFRDSYQTASFLATQIALDDAKNGKKVSQDEINKKLGNARIFETGFNKPIDLSKGGSNCISAQECDSYHPRIYRAWPNWKIVVAVGVILVSIIFLANRLSERCRTIREKIIKFAWDCIELDMNLFNQVRTNTGWALIQLLPQVLILVVLVVAGYESYLGDKGEPFYWSEGVSMWPTELIRLFAGILGCLLIAETASKVELNKRQLSSKFFCLDRIPDEQIPKIDDSLCKEGERVNVSMLWSRYCQETSAASRNPRVIFTSLIFASFGMSLLYVVGFPNVPYRGTASLLANYLALFFCVSVFLILVMMVLDATWRSVDLITWLTKNTSVWPEETLRRFDLEQDISTPEAVELANLRDELSKNNKYYLNEWMDIQFIAAHTKEVGKLVYYPFIILILMIFARSKIFDNWNMPWGLSMIFLLSAGLTLICALHLRRTAERARQAVSRQISSMLIGLKSRPEKAARTLEKQACIALKQIQEINEGAFLPLAQEPAVQALMLPFGGWGGVTLLEYFVLNGF